MLRSLALILTSNFSPLTSSMVWPLPRSLAATYGISVDFFSCRYLDVSVPCVCPTPEGGTGPSARWVVPFGVRRIISCLLIPGNFRSLPRPSSLPEAKASPIRPS